MVRITALCAALWVALVMSASAGSALNPAQIDRYESAIAQDESGRTTLRLALSHGVPFRVFTLDEPARLVLDFREVDWSGLTAERFLGQGTGIDAVRFGAFQKGWSRLVADLNRPMIPEDVAMTVDEHSGSAVLQLFLVPSESAAFAAASGAPDTALWPRTDVVPPSLPIDDGRFVVAIDPGHGGIDPGAEREGLSEKLLVLDIAQELKELLHAEGDVAVVLTRDSDVFVSLDARVAIAHQAGADLFVSLHADALSEGGAHGATIYTLSEEASDTASAHLAARHNRADIIAGADLTGADDQVTRILLDLARQETEPRSRTLAQSFVDSMAEAGGPMNSRPLRKVFRCSNPLIFPRFLSRSAFCRANAIWRTCETRNGAVRLLLQWRVQS